MELHYSLSICEQCSTMEGLGDACVSDYGSTTLQFYIELARQGILHAKKVNQKHAGKSKKSNVRE